MMKQTMRNVTFYATSLLLIAATCVQAEVIKITSVEQLKKLKRPAIVKFYGSWCHVCKDIEESYQELSKDSECSDVAFCEVDIDKMPELSKEYNIKGVPTFAYFNKEQKNVHEVVGVSNIKKFKEERKKEIQQVFGNRTMVARVKQGFKDSFQYVATKTKSLFGIA